MLKNKFIKKTKINLNIDYLIIFKFLWYKIENLNITFFELLIINNSIYNNKLILIL